MMDNFGKYQKTLIFQQKRNEKEHGSFGYVA